MDLLKILKDVLENSLTAPKDTSVFHYTIRSAFDSIMLSSCLRFNNHRALNEKGNRELISGIELANDLLQRVNLCKLRPLFNTIIQKHMTFCTISFCKEFQSSYAIKKYGNECLEVKSNSLQQFSNDNKAVVFGNVEYNLLSQKKILITILDAYLANSPPLYAPSYLFSIIALSLPFFKQEKDSKDAEARLVGVKLELNGQSFLPLLPSGFFFK